MKFHSPRWVTPTFVYSFYIYIYGQQGKVFLSSVATYTYSHLWIPRKVFSLSLPMLQYCCLLTPTHPEGHGNYSKREDNPSCSLRRFCTDLSAAAKSSPRGSLCFRCSTLPFQPECVALNKKHTVRENKQKIFCKISKIQ